VDNDETARWDRVLVVARVLPPGIDLADAAAVNAALLAVGLHPDDFRSVIPDALTYALAVRLGERLLELLPNPAPRFVKEDGEVVKAPKSRGPRPS